MPATSWSWGKTCACNLVDLVGGRNLVATSWCNLVDNFTLLVGAVVPMFFLNSGFNFIVAAKVGVELSSYLRVATGFETMMIPFLTSGALGFVFGNATLGDENMHLSVAVGNPLKLSSSNSELGSAIMTVSGNIRVSKGAALINEN